MFIPVGHIHSCGLKNVLLLRERCRISFGIGGVPLQNEKIEGCPHQISLLQRVLLMLLYIALLNCLLCLLMLVFNWKVNRNVLFLALLIALISTYTITYYFLAVSPSRFWSAVFYTNFAPVWYLTGPFLYWYIRGNLEDRIRFRKTDWLHLLPFVVTLIGIFPYLITPFHDKLQTVDALLRDANTPKFAPTNWLVPLEWNLLLRPALVIGYAVFCIMMVMKAQKQFSKSTSVTKHQWLFLRNWMWILCGVLIIISMPSLVMSYLYVIDIQIDYNKIANYSVSYLTAYAQLLLSITLLIFPRILYGIPVATSTEQRFANAERPVSVKSKRENGLPTIERNDDEDPFVNLSKRVLRYMDDERPYVDPDFTLEQLARLMDVPKHHLYYCFQHILKMKFTQLRTAYRIGYAKTLLRQADFNKEKINTIGKDAGFASTSAFYASFKAEVGCTPGEYAATNSSEH